MVSPGNTGLCFGEAGSHWARDLVATKVGTKSPGLVQKVVTTD